MDVGSRSVILLLPLLQWFLLSTVHNIYTIYGPWQDSGNTYNWEIKSTVGISIRDNKTVKKPTSLERVQVCPLFTFLDLYSDWSLEDRRGDRDLHLLLDPPEDPFIREGPFSCRVPSLEKRGKKGKERAEFFVTVGRTLLLRYWTPVFGSISSVTLFPTVFGPGTTVMTQQFGWGSGGWRPE